MEIWGVYDCGELWKLFKTEQRAQEARHERAEEMTRRYGDDWDTDITVYPLTVND